MTNAKHVQAQLAQVFFNAVRRNLAAHRRYVETLGEQTVKDGTCVGFIELDRAGEAVIEVDFPLNFIERPIFTAGLELRSGSLEFGQFPEWSATIGRWNTRIVGDDVKIYQGVTLGVVVNEIARADLHYCFQGRAITSPAGPSEDVGAIL